jgi:hypothetical protein
MSMPPLRTFASELECGLHYKQVYCSGPIPTFDGIMVRFDRRDFLHLFYESRRGEKKNVFSIRRSERIDWIKGALQDPHAELFQGYDKETKSYDPERRVCVISGNYVVVIALTDVKKADIVTAYVIDDPNVLTKLRSGPKWK